MRIQCSELDFAIRNLKDILNLKLDFVLEALPGRLFSVDH